MEYKALCSSFSKETTGLKEAIRRTLSILWQHRIPLTYKKDYFSSHRSTELGINWVPPFSSTFFGAKLSSLRGQPTEYLPLKLPQCSPGAWAYTDLLYSDTLHLILGSYSTYGSRWGWGCSACCRSFHGPASIPGWQDKSNCSGTAAAAGPLLLYLPLICQALLSLWKSGLQ